MKHLLKGIPIVILILISLYPLIWTGEVTSSIKESGEKAPLLPTTAKDVIIMVVDFSEVPGDVLDPKNLMIIKEIETSIQEMEGLRNYSSLLTAAVVRTEADDLIVLPFITKNLFTSYEQGSADRLKEEYPDFPEIWPYMSSDFESCTFYLEPGITYPSHRLVEKVSALRQHVTETYGITVEFTGLRPIKVFIENYLTKDIVILFPLLFLLISLLYLFVFRSVKIFIVSWFVKILSTTCAFGLYCFFGKGISPLIILVPVFNVGLLSDYLIHMFYHIQGKGTLAALRTTRDYLVIPLSLTALTSIIGFFSLMFIGAQGHFFLAFLVGISILITYLLTLWWVPAISMTPLFSSIIIKPPARTIVRAINRLFTIVFLFLYKIRFVLLLILLGVFVFSIFHIPRLELQPYPLQQLPESSTIIQSENLLNNKFSGTIPFMIEIDSGDAHSFLDKKNLTLLRDIHQTLSLNGDVGYQHSMLTIIEKINYYFNNSQPEYLRLPDEEDEQVFSSMIEQYLLFYSSSAGPEEYESFIDPNYRIVSIQGIIKYRGVGSIDSFLLSLKHMRDSVPSGWRITLFGPLDELIHIAEKLRNNWFLSLGIGCLLIFLTVLIFFRDIIMSLISLSISLGILLIITGIIPLSGIKIDEYTIIFIAVTTGLTIDYTIHILNAVKKIKKTGSYHNVMRYGLYVIRTGGVPVFLSFFTSVLAFAILYASSFRGAVNLAIMLSIAVGSAFSISVFLLPMFFIPVKKA
jgi:predicted RND superfamily exporter protein